MRRKLARLLRRWADRMDPLDLRPNYQDMKILRKRDIMLKGNPHMDSRGYFLTYEERRNQIKDIQKRDILEKLGQYMVVNHYTYPTHDLIETRISVLVE